MTNRELALRLNLAHESGKIEVNASSVDLSGFQVVFVEGAAEDLNGPSRGLDIGKAAFMYGVKAPFHGDKLVGMCEVADGMHIAWESINKRNHKVVSNGGLSFQRSRGKLNDHVVRIISQDLLYIGAFPGIEILLDKSSYRFGCRYYKCGSHRLLSRCWGWGMLRPSRHLECVIPGESFAYPMRIVIARESRNRFGFYGR